MGGYVHKAWSEMKRHPYQKMTNLQDHNEMSRENFDACFPTRRLSNWEVAELREFCEAKGLTMPEIPERTLENFIRLTGKPPAEV